MVDSQSTGADEPADEAADDGDPQPDAAPAETVSTEELRRRVEREYDFEDFGPEDMAAMSAEEWEAAFDPDTWITGPELLDRVEADLKHRVRERDVFARVERIDGRVVAYSDEGYAAVEPDGSVEGFGTVMRDVEPTVALCSMDSYEVPEMPDGEVLPDPGSVPEGSGELGNLVLQVVGGTQLLAGVALVVAWLAFVTGLLAPPTDATGDALNLTLVVLAGLGFLVIGVIMFVVVANARLSDRFRAEEYRNRLRAVGIAGDERPEFLPVENGRWVEPADRDHETGER
ncbi:MAG: hypothetical protein ABEJ31_07240 [Haloarculaceae archaeon]